MNGRACAGHTVKDRGWRPARCAARRVLDRVSRAGFHRAIGSHAPHRPYTEASETASHTASLNYPSGRLDNGVHLKSSARGLLFCRLLQEATNTERCAAGHWSESGNSLQQQVVARGAKWILL